MTKYPIAAATRPYNAQVISDNGHSDNRRTSGRQRAPGIVGSTETFAIGYAIMIATDGGVEE